LPNVIKIDPYNFELYRFKIGAFLRHSVDAYRYFEKSCLWEKNTKIRSHSEFSFRTAFWSYKFSKVVADMDIIVAQINVA